MQCHLDFQFLFFCNFTMHTKHGKVFHAETTNIFSQSVYICRGARATERYAAGNIV